MWRLSEQLSGHCVYLGQEVIFIGSTVAKVDSIYVGGQKVRYCYLLIGQPTITISLAGFQRPRNSIDKVHSPLSVRESHNLYSGLSRALGVFWGWRMLQ